MVVVGPGIGAFQGFISAGGLGQSPSPGGASGAAGLAGPLSVGFAVAGGILSFIAQHSRNKAIRAAALAAMRQINEQITQAKVQFSDDVRRRSAIGQMAIASARNQFGAQTGLSISERLAAMAADMTLDTEALRASVEARVSALGHDKARIAAGASAQSRSTAVAAVEGAISFASFGLSLASSLTQLKQIRESTSLIQRLGDIYGGLDAARFAGVVAQNETLRFALTRITRDTRALIDATRGIEGGLNIAP